MLTQCLYVDTVSGMICLISDRTGSRDRCLCRPDICHPVSNLTAVSLLPRHWLLVPSLFAILCGFSKLQTLLLVSILPSHFEACGLSSG